MEQKTTGANSSVFPLPSSQLLASFVGTVLGEVTEKVCVRKSFLTGPHLWTEKVATKGGEGCAIGGGTAMRQTQMGENVRKFN